MIFCFSGIEFGSKNQPKIDPKMKSEMGFVFFGSKSPEDAPQDAARRFEDAARRPQDAPRCTKMLSRSLQESPRRTQDGPRRPQDGPKTAPKRPQDATKTAQEPQEHTRSKFGRFLVPKPDGSPSPSLDVRGLWVHFGTTFGAKFALRNFEKHVIKFQRSKG